ncbi:uncharacterized protein LOC106160802 [Lingula anatina]|uniref:Uncharacterized protein LOC106160802 n=1 Tax=Lingula anatina TaxID=7574 RepID=A0A1S3I6L0_LINAN|nr:uncharacterized protein LOC106160802 [Lingula anatina]XP_013393010.1 uncharacterized protein LOC106160802 [Lingula anatina]XP_023931460.1 uncharacterized protein LOC106160802 [Lingula anatina]XP_023931461.1 uncharacterized protein LOC106160802 [Lingula anatina]|eukprot:XP_013393009.1 uncharacterized protein LOC106160802 [Lingula anatina]
MQANPPQPQAPLQVQAPMQHQLGLQNANMQQAVNQAQGQAQNPAVGQPPGQAQGPALGQAIGQAQNPAQGPAYNQQLHNQPGPIGQGPGFLTGVGQALGAPQLLTQGTHNQMPLGGGGMQFPQAIGNQYMATMGWQGAGGGQPPQAGVAQQILPGTGMGVIGMQLPHAGVAQQPIHAAGLGGIGGQPPIAGVGQQPTTVAGFGPGMTQAGLTVTPRGQATAGPATTTNFLQRITAKRNTLLRQAKAPSTTSTYGQVEKYIDAFELKSGLKLFPGDAITTSLFVTFLSEWLAPGTIRTLLSALSYKYKVACWPDPTKHFLVVETWKGHYKHAYAKDKRLPITLDILTRLHQQCARLFPRPYDVCLYQTMMLLAFFGLLRISELVQTTAEHAVLAEHVEIHSDKAIITLPSHKHSSSHIASKITLWRQQYLLCPVQQLERYLAVRPYPVSSQLFVSHLGYPISRAQFVRALSHLFHSLQLNSTQFKSHSFRIGGATFAASLGMSSEAIRQLGRWKSSAFTKYIRY